jgi:hypothetical protein
MPPVDREASTRCACRRRSERRCIAVVARYQRAGRRRARQGAEAAASDEELDERRARRRRTICLRQPKLDFQHRTAQQESAGGPGRRGWIRRPGLNRRLGLVSAVLFAGAARLLPRTGEGKVDAVRLVMITYNSSLRHRVFRAVSVPGRGRGRLFTS